MLYFVHMRTRWECGYIYIMYGCAHTQILCTSVLDTNRLISSLFMSLGCVQLVISPSVICVFSPHEDEVGVLVHLHVDTLWTLYTVACSPVLEGSMIVLFCDARVGFSWLS